MQLRRWFFVTLAAGALSMAVPTVATATVDNYVHVRVPGHRGRHHWRVVGSTPDGNIILELGPTVRHPLRARETVVVSPSLITAQTGHALYLY